MRKKIRLEAQFEQVLLYADGPQVVLLSAPETKIVGIAIDLEGRELPFYAAQVTDGYFHDYLRESFDLRYLLMKPDFRRNYIFDLSEMSDGKVPLERVKWSPVEAEDYLPDAGVFARHHTEPVSFDPALPNSTQKFGLDGKWEVPEVSNFYAQITDLYAMFRSIDMFLDEQSSLDRKRLVREAFTKPFIGGGSYVSLYNSLEAAVPFQGRLQLEGMSYHSPGYVSVRGHAKPLAEIRAFIEHLDANSAEIDKAYKALHKFLSERKFLRMHASRFHPDRETTREVREKARVLAQELDAIDFDHVLRMAGNNILVAAKVILSIARRAERVHEFFLQGRASFDVPTSQAF